MSGSPNRTESVFSSVREYFRRILSAFWTVLEACATTFPYLFRLGERRKEVTEQYPDPISSRTADDLPPRSRGLLFNDIDRCTGCRECEKVCPVQCIHIATEPGADHSKVWVATFDIDFARCLFCGLCTEVCEPSSLTHTRQYEGSAYALPNLVASFGRGQVTAEQRAKWATLRRMSETEENSP